MPSGGSMHSLTGAVVLVQATLGLAHAALAAGVAATVPAPEKPGRRGATGELLGVEMRATSDAVNVLFGRGRGRCRRLKGFALSLGEAFGGLVLAAHEPPNSGRRNDPPQASLLRFARAA